MFALGLNAYRAPPAVREMSEAMTVVLFFCRSERLCEPSRHDGVLGFNFQLNVPQFVLMFLDVFFELFNRLLFHCLCLFRTINFTLRGLRSHKMSMCYTFVRGLRKIGDAEDGEGLTHKFKKYTPPACLSHVFAPVLLFSM